MSKTISGLLGISKKDTRGRFLRIVGAITMLVLLMAGGAESQTNTQDTSDIVSYYRGFGSNPNVTETIDLLRAADNWSFDDVQPGFVDPISDPQLLDVVDEWKFGLITSSPNITSLSPSSLEENVEGGTQIFKIYVDQHVDITWYINGTEVSNQSDVTKSIYINNTAAVGTWIVNVTASNKNGAISHEWVWVVGPPPEPTSFELIEQARINGTIDNETALIYKVYVEFADSRLPDQYHGNDSGSFSATSLMVEVGSQFYNFTPETQNILYPFFIPAYINGSWHYLRNHPEVQSSGSNSMYRLASAANHDTLAAYGAPPGGPNNVDWDYVDSESPANVRIWYQKRYIDKGDKANAIIIKYAIETTIRPSLFSLMKKEPLSDLGIGMGMNGAISPGDPGAGRLDIALVDFDSNNPISMRSSDVAGNTVPFYNLFINSPCQAPTPSFIQINRKILSDPKHIFSTTTHEYMHAILFAFKKKTGCDSPEYMWLHEATAKWAEDHVYHDTIENVEHEYAKYFLDVPEESLESRMNNNDYHPYGAYLFPFYLAQILGKPELIKSIWDNAENYDSLESIDRAIPGGFKTQWPEFVRYNWNKQPFDQYQKRDPNPPLTKGAVTVGTPKGDSNNHVEIVDLFGLPEIEFTMDANINHLAAHYYHFIFNDPNVRSVAFYNPFIDLTNPSSFDPAVNITALVKIVGKDWDVQDWTYLPAKSFCLDKNEERVDELVIIFSNRDWHNHVLQPVAPPRLMANNIGCWRWKGSAADVTLIHNVVETGTAKASIKNIVLENKRYTSPGANVFRFWDNYALINGAKMTASYSAIYPGGCSYNYKGDFNLPPNLGQGFTVNNYVLNGPDPLIFMGILGTDKRSYMGQGWYTGQVRMDVHCPDGSGFSDDAAGAGGSWLDAGMPPQHVEKNGIILDYISDSSTEVDRLVTWKFEPLREN